MLRIASYNVHRCVGTDGRRDPERIAQVISELQADVVGLQEVDSREDGGREGLQLALLAEVTGMRAYTGPTISRTDGRYGNALLTRCPVLHVRRHDLTYRQYEPRGALDVDLWVGGSAMRVLVTHMGLRWRERRVQARWLLRVLSQPPASFEVVLGDTNEWFPLGAPLRWFHARLGRTPARRTFPSRFPLVALDRVWVRHPTAVVEAHPHASPLARVASDHLPIVATVRLPRGPRETRGSHWTIGPAEVTLPPSAEVIAEKGPDAARNHSGRRG